MMERSFLRTELNIVIRISFMSSSLVSAYGSEMSGRKEDMFRITLHTLFVLPASVPEEKRFDLHVLALTLLINLVENCVENR